MPSLFRQFRNFMREYSISYVAIGIVMGIAARDYAEALVKDLLMPVIAVFLPGTDWAEWVLPLGAAKVKIGHLLASSVNFVVICFFIFLFAKVAVRAARD